MTLDEIYKDAGYNDIVHNVNGVPIPLDPNWKKIGIAISGGADSALLGYILCKLITDNKLDTEVHVISNIRGWKNKPWQRQDSKEVFDYIKQAFPNITFKRHENFVPPEFEWADKGPTLVDEYGKSVSGDNIELRAFAEFVGHSENLNAYFNAVTRNPKSINIDNAMPTRNLEPSVENVKLMIMPHMKLTACHPFRFIEKDWIVNTYRLLDQLELFDITRSCEGDITTRPEIFVDLDYRTYIPGQLVPICGRCFWCQERKWGWTNAK